MTDWNALTNDFDWVDCEPVAESEIEAYETAMELTLPEGVRWLEQQPFKLYREFQYWKTSEIQSVRSGPVCHSPSWSMKVTSWAPGTHFWDRYVDAGYLPSVYARWIPKLLVFWRDEYKNTYALDYNFDATSPPVVYSNWSEGSGLVGCADIDYVSDSYEDFLKLPALVQDDTFAFVPPQPERVEEWQAWMRERVAQAASA